MRITKPRPGLTIGETARRSGCNIETVRYYERTGLMPKPPRSEGGHRLYGDDAVSRLAFIRRARELGFAIKDIRALLGLVDRRAANCGQVKRIAEKQLDAIQARIGDLRRLERDLEGMISLCSGRRIPDCPVIDSLFDRARARTRDNA
jgi:MerR family mercuric resistance operon transcriptional regulator